MNYGFVKIASIVPEVSVSDCRYNTEKIIDLAKEAYKNDNQIIVYPELSIPAYTCGDLFLQSFLLKEVENSINTLCNATKELKDMLIVVGAPLMNKNKLYNCAVAIENGKIEGVVPKTFLPNYREYYEKRWFTSAYNCKETTITILGQNVPFGSDLIFSKGDAKISIEICEDLWTPIPPSSFAAIAGANVVLNLSATNEVISKNKYLKELIKQQSARCMCAYIYSSAGYGESTTDLVYAGNAIIAENGAIIRQNNRFDLAAQSVSTYIDVERLVNERRLVKSFSDRESNNYREIYLKEKEINLIKNFDRFIDPHPFVPAIDNELDERCEEIINIQTHGLIKRLDFTHAKNLVIGISGGLDSTLALLVAVNAFDKLKLDRKGIIGITMPGFGTTDRTYNNALSLMSNLGVTKKEISITDAVIQHFKDIEHQNDKTDITYENSQARERTQILMDYANKENGFVLGTGDLSELALGWATYNGDHMSMYGVNCSIPKTLVRCLVKWFSEHSFADVEVLKAVLLDIVDTPISPELIPCKENGEIKQITEDVVGPYELHDFFLYYMMRFGFAPKKIYFLAQKAFANKYDDATIKKWIKNYYRRFFMQQFKRSCLPDGPKVGSVSLSPRGDWRMPSDASSKMWLSECDNL